MSTIPSSLLLVNEKSEEYWREIPGFPGYSVSNLGRVRAQKRRGVSGNPRVGIRERDRYRIKLVRPDGGVSYPNMGNVVLEAFIGPCPLGHRIKYTNGIKGDNRLCNLTWEEIRDAKGNKQRCRVCQKMKPLVNFSLRQSSHNGRGAVCTKCRKRKRRQARIAYRLAGKTVAGKVCTRCKQHKGALFFYRNANVKSGLTAYCKECSSERARELRNSGKAIQRERRLRLRRHGLTVEDYERLFAAQSGVCAICKQPQSQRSLSSETLRGDLCVDHDHATGKIRDLLCHSCNKLLGLAKDNPELLEACVGYLRKHKDIVTERG